MKLNSPSDSPLGNFGSEDLKILAELQDDILHMIAECGEEHSITPQTMIGVLKLCEYSLIKSFATHEKKLN